MKLREHVMNDPAAKNPLMEDLKLYAEEFDATLTVPYFVAWLLTNRPQLARLNPKDLETIAAESLYKFAHEPEPPT